MSNCAYGCGEPAQPEPSEKACALLAKVRTLGSEEAARLIDAALTEQRDHAAPELRAALSVALTGRDEAHGRHLATWKLAQSRATTIFQLQGEKGDLRERAEKAEAEVDRLRAEVTYQTNTRKAYEGALSRANVRAEKFADERDALRATVARVEALAVELDYSERYDDEGDQDWRDNPVQCIRDALRAALAGPSGGAGDE